MSSSPGWFPLRQGSTRGRSARIVAAALVLAFLVGTAVAAVTVVNLGFLNPVDGSVGETVDGPVRVESWELIRSSGTVTGANVTLGHLSAHRLGCTVRSRLEASNGTTVTETDPKALYLPANTSGTLTLDFRTSVDVDSFSIFRVTTSDCSMLAWPMAGFNASHAGNSTRFLPSLAAPPTLAANWTTEVSTNDPLAGAPTVAENRTYVGSADDTLYALHERNGTVDWTLATTGDVNGSAAVAGGTLYVGSAGGTLYALDPATGGTTWTNASVGAVRSSPAVANGTVFVGSDDNSVHALSTADGSGTWAYATGGDVRAAPAVVDGTVFAASLDGSIYALDASDGSVQWSNATGGAIYSHPAVANDTVYLGSDDGFVYARNASTGTERWVHDANGAVRTGPAIVNGTLYVGTDGGSVVALDAGSGTKLWTQDLGGQVRSTPAVANGTVYVGADDGNVYALAARNGTELGVHDVGGGVTAGPTVVDDYVHVASTDGRVSRLAAETLTDWRMFGVDETNVGFADFDAPTTGVTTAWTTSTGANVTAGAAVVNDTVFVGSNDGTLYALWEKDGTQRWTATAPGAIQAAPAVVNGSVFVGSRDDSVYSFAESNGAQQWAFATGGDVDAPPSVLEDTVYVGSDDDSLYALNAWTGSERWSFQTGGDVAGASAVDGDTVYVPSMDESVYGLDRSTGERRWRFRAGADVPTAPALEQGSLYVGDDANEGPFHGELNLTTAGQWDLGDHDGTAAHGHDGSVDGDLSMTYANGTRHDDLIGYWRLDEAVAGDGGTVQEYGGADLDGTINGSVTTGVTGTFGTQSMDFSDGQQIQIPKDATLEPRNALTVSVWVRRNGSQVDYAKPIWYGPNDDAPWGPWGFQTVGSSDTDVQFHLALNGTDYYSSAVTVNDQQWHHLVGTYNGSGFAIYRDGDRVSSTLQNGEITDYRGNEGLGIGGRYNGGQSWSGKVDEVRIYDHELSEAAIERLYRNGRSGTYYGNYSRAYETDQNQNWTTLRANVLEEPAATDVDATVEVYDDGAIVDSQEVELTTSATSYDLSLSNAENARLEVNGTTTNASQSWRIDYAAIEYTTVPGSSTTTTSGNRTVSTVSDWNNGTFDKSTADAKSGGAAGDLTMSYANTSTNLVGYYRLDDATSGSGGNVEEYSGNDVDGTTANGTTTGAQGVFNTTSFNFSGNNGEIVTAGPNEALEPSNEVSVSMWVRRDGTQVSYAKPLWYGPNNDSPWGPYGFELNGTTDNSLRFHVATGSCSFQRTNTVTLNNHEWHHVVGTYNGSHMAIYRDGSLVDAVAQSGSICDYDNTNGLGIGAKYQRGQEWEGNVDEVRIYNSGMSSQAVRDLYRSGMDGTFESNYSQNLDTSGDPAWDTLEVTVPALPSATSVDVTIEAIESGTVQNSKTVTPGEGTNSYSLSFGNTSTTRIEVNGTTTDETQSWAIGRISLTNSSTSTSLDDPVVCRVCRPVVTNETEQWDNGHYNGTTADAANGTLGDRLGLTYANGTVGDGLTGYWRMDRDVSGSGGTVVDYSGEGHDGTATGGVETGRTGVLGTQAMSFGGSSDDDVVQVPRSDGVNVSGDFAVSAWLKTTTLGTSEHGSNQTAIVTKGAFGTKNGWELLDNGDDTSAVHFRVMGGSSFYDVAVDRSTVNDGNWHHLVGVREGNETRLYVDGVVVDSTSGTEFDSADVAVGIGADWGGGREMGSGSVDEVRLYDRALSDWEVRRLYRYGTDGTYGGNYSRELDAQSVQSWTNVTANVTTLPSGASLSLTVQAIAGGAVLGSDTIALSSGERTYPLDVPESENAYLLLNGTTEDPTHSWTVANVTVHRESAPPDQLATTDARPEWQDGTYDGTGPDGENGTLRGTLSMRYANGTADDDLVGFYRFDGPAATTSIALNHTISNVTTFDQGTYDATTADGYTGSVAGDLHMTYANGTASDSLAAYYRFDGNVSGGGGSGTAETITTTGEWDAGTYDGTTADGANGTLDDTLTMTYANGTGDESPKVYYRMDGSPAGDAGTVEDYSGNANDGTTHNGLVPGQPGVFGTTSYRFASDDYVSVGGPDFVGDITVSAWIHMDSTSDADEVVSGGRTYFALRENASGYYVWRTHDGAYHSTGYDATKADTWVHLVGRFNTSESNELSLWVNGTRVDSASGGLTDPGRDIEIGRDPEFSSKYFDGEMDEVRLYNTSLSDAAIEELYRHGRSGTYYGNYSRTYSAQDPSQWDTLEVDATALPAPTSVDVTVEAVDAGGTVVDSSTHSLTSTGVSSFDLSLSSATDTRIAVNGTTTDVNESFAIDQISLVEGASAPGNATDYSGNGHTGTVDGGVTTNVTGTFGTRAFEFAGTNDSVNLGEPAALDDSGSVAISAWVNVSAVSGTHQPVVVKGDTAYHLKLNSNDNWEFSVHNGSTWKTLYSNEPATAGQWVHLVGTYDDAAGEIQLWVDGTSQGTTSATLSTNDFDLAVGNNTEKPKREFDGRIDEVRIYDGTLSSTDVTRLYRNGRSGTYYGNYTQTVTGEDPADWSTLEVDVDALPAGTSADVTLKALDSGGATVDSETYALSAGTQTFSPTLASANATRIDVNATTTDVTASFDLNRLTLTGTRTTDATAYDYSGNGRDGTPAGSITANVDGTFNSTAFDFDGTDDEVDLGNGSAVNVTGDLTIGTWARPDTADGDVEAVVTKGTDQYALRINANDRWEFAVHDGTSEHAVTGPLVQTGAWTHLTGRYDASSDTLELFVNGTSQGTATSSALHGNAADARVGNNSAATGRHFDGTIDEVQLYDAALSDDAVRDLARHGSDGTFEGNYSRRIDTGRTQSWRALHVDVTGLPPATTLDATVRAEQNDGTLVDSQTITLSAGAADHTLTLSDSEDLTLTVNGTTTDPAVTWALTNASVEYATASAPDAGDGELVALDHDEGTVSWALDVGVGVTTSPSVDADTVYAGLDNGTVLAVDATTGARQWSYHTANYTIRSKPAVVNETVYVGSNSGSVYALNATDGTLRWRHDIGAKVQSAPATINDTVYVGADDHGIRALR